MVSLSSWMGTYERQMYCLPLFYSFIFYGNINILLILWQYIISWVHVLHIGPWHSQMSSCVNSDCRTHMYKQEDSDALNWKCIGVMTLYMYIGIHRVTVSLSLASIRDSVSHGECQQVARHPAWAAAHSRPPVEYSLAKKQKC